MSNEDPRGCPVEPGILGFCTVADHLSDRSEVWAVEGRVRTPDGEIATVLKCHCVDEKHAFKLLELLEECVEIESFRAPIVPGLEVVKT